MRRKKGGVGRGSARSRIADDGRREWQQWGPMMTSCSRCGEEGRKEERKDREGKERKRGWLVAMRVIFNEDKT